MHLNRQTDFGLRALMFLASRPNEWITTAEIAITLRISRNHLLKIINRMIELHWVEGKPGRSGGVRFVAATATVSVGTVVRGLEQSLALVECFNSDDNNCPLTPTCKLAPLLYKARNAFLAELDNVTISQLLPQ